MLFSLNNELVNAEKIEAAYRNNFYLLRSWKWFEHIEEALETLGFELESDVINNNSRNQVWISDYLKVNLTTNYGRVYVYRHSKPFPNTSFYGKEVFCCLDVKGMTKQQWVVIFEALNQKLKEQ